MMTELGEPLHTIRLLQLSWIERLKIVKGIAEILHRLAHSPLGSLSMNDMRRQQFVLVDNTLKLSDVDDVGIAEPTCLQDEQCAIRANNDSVIEQLICLNNTCKGYNERLNIWRAGQHFIIKQFLPIGAPPFLESHIRDLLDAFERRSASATWDTQRILEATNSLLHLYETHDIDGTRKNYGSRKIPEEV
ncbi:hypothetical protein LSTR_LSTR002305 [Laodelphax striatellus]|uniref:FAM69 protein-kinase domain-containing protein n=1 Tax=Laodelphax striatellus TaxID=195883 RepID=A0A482XFN4_LAOST|nr:hypothetical protein LSTR_LSTR002305 [Laodelphax striatellus]